MAWFSRVVCGALLCASFAACAASRDPEPEGPILEFPAFITPTPMFSAYDGVHEYQVTATFSRAALAMGVDFSSVRWTIDDSIVTHENFDPIPGALLLTTKQAGSTQLRVRFTTVDGKQYRSMSTLTISKADADEWAKGDERYEHGRPLRLEPMPAQPADAEDSACGLSEADFKRLPTLSTSACANCHDPANGVFDASTPLFTSFYDNDELIEMFSTGVAPLMRFRTPFMQSVSQPECVFRAFHTWNVTDEEKAGLVWKLRSMKLHLGAEY